jgi:hypothetical protein
MVSVTEFTLYFKKKKALPDFQFIVTQLHVYGFEKFKKNLYYNYFLNSPQIFRCGNESAIRRKWRQNTAGR